MKKSFLLFLVSLMVMGASAQLHRPGEVLALPELPKMQVQPRVKAQSETQQMRAPGESVNAPRKAIAQGTPYYNRPAGAFYTNVQYYNGGNNDWYNGFLYMKPFSDYTFYGVANGVDDSNGFMWSYPAWYESGYMYYKEVNALNLTQNYRFGMFELPELSGDDSWMTVYQYPLYPGKRVVSNNPALVLSYPYINEDGNEYLWSSKTMCHYTEESYAYVLYDGAEPYGNNSKGYWFGKNGGSEGCRIDGIAQAFEKPEHPYLLNKVVMSCAFLEVNAPVELTCKVYELDNIPQYEDTCSAVLPDEPGKLIAKGRAVVTPETLDENIGNVSFTLYGEEDGLEYDVTPTIDNAILVVIDGYNEPEMADLVNFSAMVSSTMDIDEGFGELAYLKVGTPVENSDQYSYQWKGLNNFFGTGQMMTGFTIFIVIDHPFLVYNWSFEDGEFIFPEEGGRMYREIENMSFDGIDFFTCTPSYNEDWIMTCGDELELPEWLNIELVDQMDGDMFQNEVKAVVEADPLPAGVTYREAVVRFWIPGDYKDYKFIQAGMIGPNDYCTDPDPWQPEINIATVNRIIDIILGAKRCNYCMRMADCNSDGVVNISDVNIVIDLILYK